MSDGDFDRPVPRSTINARLLPIPLHLQTCFAYLGHGEGSFPVSERLAKETLALPVHPELAREDLERVADAVTEFYQARN